LRTDDGAMTRQHAAAIFLSALAIAGVLAAAAFSGSSEGAPFAVPGSLACIDNPALRPTPIPTLEITPENLSEFSRLINAWQSEKNRLSSDHFIADRVSVASATRAESSADRVELPAVEEPVAGAGRVGTGTVRDQRLERRSVDGRSHVVLVSQLDGDHARVVQAISAQCGDTLLLVYYLWDPALAPGSAYALVVDREDRVLLAYQRDGAALIAPSHPLNAQIPGGSTLDNLIDAVEDAN
jgi:hypothetical protein